MTLTLELTPTEEERLTAAAIRAGVAPAALLKKFVDDLPSPSSSIPAVKNLEARPALRG